MATAREYFEKALNTEVGLERQFQFQGEELITVSIKIVYDFEAGSKYIKIFIPETAWPDNILAMCLEKQEEIWILEKDLVIDSGIAGGTEKISNQDLRFTGRFLVWTPTKIPYERWDNIGKQMGAQGLSLIVRDAEYVALRDKYDFPLAFISHDSRDKITFVKDLAAKLSSSLCPVWYDEYSLKPGDSLRSSIEAGLKACPKCIVVLSENFFENPGWVRREFDMIYTREVIEGKRIMIPIWLNVTKQQVFEFSPILADTVGIDAGLGVDEVTRRLMGVLNYVPPYQETTSYS
jgi:hypothetical protein